MKSILILFSSLLALCGLAGCAGTTQLTPKANATVAHVNLATFVVKRNSNLVNGAMSIRVSADSQKIGTVGSGGTLCWHQEPGLVTVSFDGNSDDPESTFSTIPKAAFLLAEKNRIYEFETGYSLATYGGIGGVDYGMILTASPATAPLVQKTYISISKDSVSGNLAIQTMLKHATQYEIVEADSAAVQFELKLKGGEIAITNKKTGIVVWTDSAPARYYVAINGKILANVYHEIDISNLVLLKKMPFLLPNGAILTREQPKGSGL